MTLNTDFLAPARQGGVTATGRITGGGRRLLFIAADLVHDDGTLLATASGVFKRATVGPGMTAAEMKPAAIACARRCPARSAQRAGVGGA